MVAPQTTDERMERCVTFVLALCTASFLCAWNFYFVDRANASSFHLQVPETRKTPIIVGYTGFFSQNMTRFLNEWSESYCPVRCTFSDDKSLLENASMVLFHGLGLDAEKLPKIRNQTTAFIILESPVNLWPRRRLPADYFDLFVSYRRDSDVLVTYDAFREIGDESKNYMKYSVWDQKEVQRIISNKSKLAVQFVSNCGTHSKREQYVAAMMKYTNLTSVGGCGNTKCPRNVECERRLIDTHYFYLAFENSVCEDYVTEKFFRMKQLIVPVVLKRSVVEGIAPEGSFIAADDFKSPKELVEFLKATAADPEKYSRYFEWTKKYYKNYAPSKMSCKLCEIAWNGLPKSARKRNIERLWNSRTMKWRTWNKIRNFLGSSLSLLCISLLLFFWSIRSYNVYWEEREIADFYEKNPVILSWTKWFDTSLTDELTKFDGLYSCEYKCIFTDDRKLYKYAQVVAFHDKDILLSDLPPVDPEKIRVYYNLDPPDTMDSSKSAFLQLPMDFFHWTLTYRQDSTFWWSYDQMEVIGSTDKGDRWTDEEIEKKLKMKSKEVMQLVSACKTKSQREDYTTYLKKSINVTELGKCAKDGGVCEEDSECERENIESHYFYLAFEKSVCLDFVTEKAFRLKQLIVPIVLSQHILNNQLPEGSFIAADDYLSPDDLAKYLKKLIANKEEYLRYFEWTKYYKKSKSIPKYTCDMCKTLLTKNWPINRKDVHTWWSRDGHCSEKNFAERLGVPQPPPPIVKPLRAFYGQYDYD